jgi:ppGpp synthetase/RelA/SpoT-type nucleotidyltranferase/Tfp pilus assembly protein PilF
MSYQALNTEDYARSAADSYRDIRNLHESFADVVIAILRASVPEGNPLHSIEGRAKTVESFERKARKLQSNDSSKPKYVEPLREITDLTGVRVITFFPKTIEVVRQTVEQEFEVLEVKDLGEERFEQGQFGYQSIHYLVNLRKERCELPEYRKYRDRTAEIQVRTILQHAWAEMEHDIQYKSVDQIPTSIRRRFIALAGVLEIADREFQAIQDEDSQLHSVVRASLQDDLTAPQITLGSRQSAEGDETPPSEHGSEEASEALSDLVGWSPGQARGLVAVGKYDEAIDLYTRMLNAQPNLHTLYLARAKARFLAGDRVGALADIDTGAQLLPNDPAVPVLRHQIEEGTVGSVGLNEAWKFASNGNNALAQGRVDEAFRYYSQSQQLGFTETYSLFNKAMAWTLAKDVDAALYFLDQIKIRKGTPMEINVLGLRAILTVIGKKAAVAAAKELSHQRELMPEYDFRQSPLRYLEQGLLTHDTSIPIAIEKIFKILKGGHDITKGSEDSEN